MRSDFARLISAAIAAAALVGCGTASGPVPSGGISNSAGGGTVNVGNQGPPSGSIASVLLDTVPGPYTGFNVAGVTTTAGPDPLAGAPEKKTAGSGAPPKDIGSSTIITFGGNGLPEEIFRLGGTLPSLVIPVNTVPGQIQPIGYGAIVFYASYTPAVALTGATPSLAVELTGGSGASTFDVRAGCASSGTANVNGFVRYVCDLPAYGSASGSYATKYAAPVGTATAGTFAGSSAGPAIQNPVVSNASGTFTASAAKLYIVATYPAPTPVAGGNALDIGYVYAEQGTQ